MNDEWHRRRVCSHAALSACDSLQKAPGHILNRIGLLERRPPVPFRGHAGAVISRRKDDRHAPLRQQRGQRKDLQPAHIDIEDGRIRLHIRLHQRLGAVQAHDWSHHGTAEVLQDHFKIHGHERLILDDENANATQLAGKNGHGNLGRGRRRWQPSAESRARISSTRETGFGSQGVAPVSAPAAAAYRVSRLYVTRFGLTLSGPSRLILSASYSAKLPSNHSTWLSPSKARMWVASRSRNMRSCEMMTAQPAKFSNASSSAAGVSVSRSLVGSSSRMTLPPSFKSLAMCTRLRWPPESVPTFCCWSPPLKLKAEQ